MDYLKDSAWFTKVDSEDMCKYCAEKKVTYCLQVEDISLYLCTLCAVNAREKIVEGLMNNIRGKIDDR